MCDWMTCRPIFSQSLSEGQNKKEFLCIILSVKTSMVDSTVKAFDDSMLYLKFVCFLNYVHRLEFQKEHRISAVRSVPSSNKERWTFYRARLCRCLSSLFTSRRKQFQISKGHDLFRILNGGQSPKPMVNVL